MQPDRRRCPLSRSPPAGSALTPVQPPSKPGPIAASSRARPCNHYLVTDRVLATISRYGMFQPGQYIGVAVSGGADSVALLHILVDLAPALDIRLAVLHLDHMLRGEESAADAVFVRDLANQLGLPFHSRQIYVAQRAAQTGDNLEKAARS